MVIGRRMIGYEDHPNGEDKDDGFLNEGSFSNAGPPPASHGRPDFRGSLHSDLLYIRKVIFHRMMIEGFVFLAILAFLGNS